MRLLVGRIRRTSCESAVRAACRRSSALVWKSARAARPRSAAQIREVGVRERVGCDAATARAPARGRHEQRAADDARRRSTPLAIRSRRRVTVLRDDAERETGVVRLAPQRRRWRRAHVSAADLMLRDPKTSAARGVGGRGSRATRDPKVQMVLLDGGGSRAPSAIPAEARGRPRVALDADVEAISGCLGRRGVRALLSPATVA